MELGGEGNAIQLVLGGKEPSDRHPEEGRIILG